MTAAWTTPAKDWTTGDPLTAAELDTHLRDNMDYLNQEFVDKLGQWTSHVPTLVQFGTVGKTVTYSRYLKIGRMVTYQFTLTVTGSGTGANAVTVSLPFNAVFGTTNRTVGSGAIYDSSAAITYPARMIVTSATVVSFTPSNVTSGGFLGTHQFTAGLANNDTIDGELTYEATS